jgi:ATP-dependent Clp protease protease subunit
MKSCNYFLLAGLLSGGCVFNMQPPHEFSASHTPVRIDYADPVLLRRQILLFGDIDELAAERAIEQLLFLEGQSHEPIDLYLMTPGGEFKSALAIEHMFHVLHSPINTYALSECNSGGALLLAAGTGKRRAFRGAMVVLHGVKVTGRLPPGALDQIQTAYTAFWRRRTHLPESWLPMPQDVLHVLASEDALRYGIVDEIIER